MLDVTGVDDEINILIGDGGKHPGQFVPLVIAVWRVTDQRKAPGFGFCGNGEAGEEQGCEVLHTHLTSIAT